MPEKEFHFPSAKKTVFLHVGTSKCGSSAIQHHMNDEPFREFMISNGYSYSAVPHIIWRNLLNEVFGPGHVEETVVGNLVRLRARYVPHGEWNFGNVAPNFSDASMELLVKGTLSMPTENVFLSMEGFSDLALFHEEFYETTMKRVLLELKKFFAVHVIMVLRPQTGFLESMYVHSVKRGCRDDLRTFAASVPIESLSWKKHCEMFSDLSSDGKVWILPFNMPMLRATLGKSFIEAFFWRCGWDVGLKGEMGTVNSSLSPDLIDVALYINRNLPPDRAIDVNDLLSIYMPKQPGEPFHILPEAWVDKMIDLYEAENAALLSEHEQWCPADALLLTGPKN